MNTLARRIISALFIMSVPLITRAETAVQTQALTGNIENGVRIIRVESFKYGYVPNPIVVRKGEQVKIELSTRDVAHGFQVNKLGIDMMTAPGKTASYSFTPDKTGDFRIRCSVYCGLGHMGMHGTLRVIP